MKIVKIILSVITIVFAGLGLFKVLSFNVSNPVMIISFATLLLVRSVEYKKMGDKSGFVLNMIIALFDYAVLIYIVFIG